MNFNFKQALQHSRTPQGKAEDFLQGTLNVIKHMSPFDELSFHLVSALTSKHAAPYSIYAVAQNGNIVYTFDPVQDYNEAISIFEAIELQLYQEGYFIQQKDSDLHRIKGFKIEI